MALRRNDRIIVSKSGDALYGLVGTIVSISGMEVEVSMAGQSGTRRFRQSEVSGIPLNVDGNESPVMWYVEIDFMEKDANMILTFERQPGISWGNGMVKIEGIDDIHLLQGSSVRHIRVHC